MKPGDKVITTNRTMPGVWTVVKVYELTVKVTLNGITHIRPKSWFEVSKPA